MAWTAPATWAVGQIVTAENLNTHLRDNLDYLYAPPACRVLATANFTLGNDSYQLLNWSQEDFDTDAMFNSATNTSCITTPTAGIYLVGLALDFAYNASGNRYGSIHYNGAQVPGAAIRLDAVSEFNNDTLIQISILATASAGGHFRAFAYQKSGADLTLFAANTRFWAHWLRANV